ncbi:hypothetical protein [Rathayibacter iranicus]|nr:hypothetical protein [Rathayibacter iranicus]MWV30277.1 hypothetical protein [Rathayibacter iranicus NCPPB 2253 = VKM Ac-1602]PWJ65465.1 hypothetical protein B0H03_103314 [Rathayibacter iranicus NCPPB 2253 = VKM Ac-1602]
MRLHRPARLAMLALVLGAVLSGCASGDVIDVPESAGNVIANAAPRSTPSVGATVDSVDCGVALPAIVVEHDLGLPAGTVTLAPAGQVCSYTIAGDDSAVVLTLRRGPLLETFTDAGEAVGAVPLSLGMAGYWLPGSGSAPSELAVLAGGWELHVVSSLGGQSTLVGWACVALASVGVPLAVA